MSNPSTLEAAAVKFIVDGEIPTSPKEIPYLLHLLIERMKQIKNQKETIEYIQQRWYVLFDQEIEADIKEGMYADLITSSRFGPEQIELFERARLFYKKNTVVFIAAMAHNDLRLYNEYIILASLEEDLPEEYKKMVFDTTHVKYTKESDPQFRNMNLEFV